MKERLFDQNQMGRKILRRIGESPAEQAYFSTAEDLILAKLEWYRNGGEVSERQWQDILGMLRIQSGRLNLDDMRKWAEKLGVIDLLEQALRE